MSEALRETKQHLANLLEWALGRRGSHSTDPEEVPEMKEALEYLARVEDIDDFREVDTAHLATGNPATFTTGNFALRQTNSIESKVLTPATDKTVITSTGDQTNDLYAAGTSEPDSGRRRFGKD